MRIWSYDGLEMMERYGDAVYEGATICINILRNNS